MKMILVFSVVTIFALSNACPESLRALVKYEVAQVENRIVKRLEALVNRQNVQTGVSGATFCSATSSWGHPFDVFGRGAQHFLAFRGTAGVGHSVYDAYIGDYNKKSPRRNIEPCCTQVNGSLPCSGHYRNAAILNNWQNIEEVVVALYDRGVLKQSLRFDAAGTTYLSWFSADKLKNSGKWRDLKSKTTNYFSIAGHLSYKRRFYINHKLHGCKHDDGWFMAMDKARPPCPYERHSSFPQFLYSSGNARALWSTSGDTVQADVMAIFVKPYNGCNNR
ncbi:uncharacterized protein LOC101851971 isoform X2 [Aplysia californica]|uniref:Uncharacterized protein LOC101851971 isoform X2 n=1 Tax=Aplysia californica TaxID=6500 RepID=A0ABM1A5E1_APLCA|nr:uncharacterized protein LOC101851971 isoform X2 [Aplysia californica]XP_012941158.1 uncharacterized protein LOC101851971 isoform X2 [Aplysia californica]